VILHCQSPQLLADGRSDYFVYEGLAEITMAILSRAKAKDPDQGYARDIIETIGRKLGPEREKGMKVVTNAGGVNPGGGEAGSVGGSIREGGGVLGDDLTGNEDVLARVELSGDLLSANVYLGARPIAAALDSGAGVVVTGQMVDSALVLGPLIHEFGWGPDQLDLLSAGSLAGHLLECGPQSTGGLLTDWENTRTWADPGFLIAEVSADCLLGCIQQLPVRSAASLGQGYGLRAARPSWTVSGKDDPSCGFTPAGSSSQNSRSPKFGNQSRRTLGLVVRIAGRSLRRVKALGNRRRTPHGLRQVHEGCAAVGTNGKRGTLRQWLLFGLILLIKAVARLPTTHLLVVPVSGLPGHPHRRTG
jgi:hypothetical protein